MFQKMQSLLLVCTLFIAYESKGMVGVDNFISQNSQSVKNTFSVIVLVNNLELWQQTPVARRGATIKSAQNENEWTVTADVTQEQLDFIQLQPFFLRFQRGTPLAFCKN